MRNGLVFKQEKGHHCHLRVRPAGVQTSRLSTTIGKREGLTGQAQANPFALGATTALKCSYFRASPSFFSTSRLRFPAALPETAWDPAHSAPESRTSHVRTRDRIRRIANLHKGEYVHTLGSSGVSHLPSSHSANLRVSVMQCFYP